MQAEQIKNEVEQAHKAFNALDRFLIPIVQQMAVTEDEEYKKAYAALTAVNTLRRLYGLKI